MTSYDFDVIGDTPQPQRLSAQKPPAEESPAGQVTAEKPPEQAVPLKTRNEAA